MTVNKRIERLHRALADLAEKFPADTRMPTLREIAEGEARVLINGIQEPVHVSRVAYQRLVARKIVYVRPGSAGTYVAEKKADSRPRLIALVTPKESRYVLDVITGIELALRLYNRRQGSAAERCRLICESSSGQTRVELELLSQLMHEADAIMLLPTPPEVREDRKHQVERLQEISRMRKPVYLIGASVNDGDLEFSGPVFAYPEHIIAARIAQYVEENYLPANQTRGGSEERRRIPLSHIYVIGERHNKALLQRAHGLTVELHDKGFDVEHILPKRSLAPEDLGPEDLGKDYVAQFIRDKKIVRTNRTLLLCTTDGVAFGVLSGLREHRHDVQLWPDHVLVMGADGDPAGKHTNPTLTSLELDAKRLGALAAVRILRELDKKPVRSVLDLRKTIKQVWNKGESAPTWQEWKVSSC